MNAVYCRTCEAIVVGEQEPFRLAVDHELDVHPEAAGAAVYERLST